MRPFKSINDEVEVGYDAGFEHRWRIAELVGRAVMLVVVVAALFGLFGRGPYSHHTIVAPASGLLVDYEPVARYGDITQITFHATPRACADGMTLWVDSKMIEPMDLQNTMPRALFATPLSDGVLLHYDLKPTGCRNTLVRLFVKPASVGLVALRARLDDFTPLSWHAFIVP